MVHEIGKNLVLSICTTKFSSFTLLDYIKRNTMLPKRFVSMLQPKLKNNYIKLNISRKFKKYKMIFKIQMLALLC